MTFSEMIMNLLQSRPQSLSQDQSLRHVFSNLQPVQAVLAA